MDIQQNSTFIQWNLESYQTKFESLKRLLQKYNPRCVCLQETRINQPTHPPSQYNILTSNNLIYGNEHGVAILIHKSVHYHQIHLQTNLEAIAARIKLDRDYTICSIYLPHSAIEYQDLDNLIAQLPTPFLLMGDMNAWHTNWYNRRNNTKGILVNRLLNNHNLVLLNNNQPTHVQRQHPNSFSIIDLSICSADCAQDFNFAVDESQFLSDHYPTHLISNNPEFSPPKRYPGWNLKLADWNTFYNETNTVPLNTEDSINESTYKITEEIQKAASLSIPRRPNSMKRPPIPWRNPHLNLLETEYIRAERAFKRNKNEHNKIRLNRAQANFRYFDKKYHQESWENFCASITTKSKPEILFRKTKILQGKYEITPTPILLNSSGETIRKPEEIANTFVDYFATVGSGSPSTTKINPRREILKDGDNYNLPITEAEFEAAISTLSDSAPGKDEITYSMIKNAHPSMKKKILELYNKIYSSGNFPEMWSTAIIIPIAKKGKESVQPSDFRPISLTCCLCKILEKIINVRLMWYLETNNFINPNQSGYRENRSTTDQLVTFTTAVTQSIARKEHSVAVFFDLQKAYDTARIDVIIENLKKAGIKGKLLVFIHNFLKDRKIMVRIEDKFSESVQTQFGIPQGSVLSCTCFILAVNNLATDLHPSIHVQIYVDDLCLLASGSQESCARRLQVAINKIQAWSLKTGFKFSPTKSATMHICRAHRCIKPSPQLTLNGTELKHVEQYKYLGMIIDEKLNWKPHIIELKRSATKSLNLLKIIANRYKGADRSTILRIYIAITKPKLDYGSEIYCTAKDDLLKTLDTVQNTALRIATGAFRSTPIVSLQAETGIKPLQVYREQKNINYMLRVMSNPDDTIYNRICNADSSLFSMRTTIPKPFNLNINNILMSREFQIENVITQDRELEPPWLEKSFKFCTELYSIKKKNHHPEEIKGIFLSHLSQYHVNENIYYTDGSKTSEGTASAYIHDPLAASAKHIKSASIYTAELHAIRGAIKNAAEKKYSSATIITDSRSALQGIKKFKNSHPIIIKIRNDISKYKIQIKFCWVPSHCNIDGNEKADQEAKNAIQLPTPTNEAIPRGDLKAEFKKSINSSLQEEWTSVPISNKLRRIKPKRGPFPDSRQSNREWEIKLARLRMGHTLYTHRHLMERTVAPFCEQCNEMITVKHILEECQRFNVARRNHFGYISISPTLNDILGENGPTNYNGPLMKFLKEINVYHQL